MRPSNSSSSRFSRDRHEVSLSSENSLVIVRWACVDVLHQAAQGRVLLVERKLFDDDVDLRLQVLAHVAMLGRQFADQPRQGARPCCRARIL